MNLLKYQILNLLENNRPNFFTINMIYKYTTQSRSAQHLRKNVNKLVNWHYIKTINPKGPGKRLRYKGMYQPQTYQITNRGITYLNYVLEKTEEKTEIKKSRIKNLIEREDKNIQEMLEKKLYTQE